MGSFREEGHDSERIACKLCRETFAYHSLTSNIAFHLQLVSSSVVDTLHHNFNVRLRVSLLVH